MRHCDRCRRRAEVLVAASIKDRPTRRETTSMVLCLGCMALYRDDGMTVRVKSPQQIRRAEMSQNEWENVGMGEP